MVASMSEKLERAMMSGDPEDLTYKRWRFDPHVYLTQLSNYSIHLAKDYKQITHIDFNPDVYATIGKYFDRMRFEPGWESMGRESERDKGFSFIRYRLPMNEVKLFHNPKLPVNKAIYYGTSGTGDKTFVAVVDLDFAHTQEEVTHEPPKPEEPKEDVASKFQKELEKI